MHIFPNCFDSFWLMQATSNLIKAKLTYVVVGDLQALPHADELGL